MGEMILDPLYYQGVDAARGSLTKLGLDLHRKINRIDHQIDYDLRLLGAHDWDCRLTELAISIHESLKQLDFVVGKRLDKTIELFNVEETGRR